MKPSGTPRGQKWVANFKPLEQPFAQLLLDSLRIVGTSEIRSGMKEKLEELSHEEIQHPAMLLAARKMNEFTLQGPGYQKSVPFQTFDPGQELPVTPGSEALMGTIIRDLIRGSATLDRGWMSPASTLDELRSKRCRSIVLLSDYSGSGKQLIDYSLALRRHPTIRSWISSGNLRIHTVVFSMSPTAVNALNHLGKRKPIVHQVEPALDFNSAKWTEIERKAIIDLCVRYAPQPRRGGMSQALGFDGSMGLFATDSSIPNNLPIILRMKRTGWNSFFDGRVMPPDISNDVTGYRGGELGIPAIAGSLPMHISRTERFGKLLILSRATLNIMHAGERSPEGVASILGLKISAVKQIIAFLHNNGMITGDGRVTGAGAREVRNMKIGATRPRITATLDEEPYYPLSLR